MSLSVHSKEDRVGVVRIALVGSLDTNTYMTLEKKVETVLEDGPNTIILDFANLDYISSAGIRVIVKAKKAMKNEGGNVVFVNLQPQIQKVFDIIKMLPSMNVFASVRELDNYLDKMQKASANPEPED